MEAYDNKIELKTGSRDKGLKLTEAIRDKRFEEALRLIEEGADINYVDIYRTTPLLYAIQYNNLDMVRVLVERGADVNYVNSIGSTPLMYAISEENFEIVKYLLDHGVKDINSGRNGTPLIMAIISKKLDMVKLLVERGADVNFTVNNLDYPLHYAILSLIDKENLDILEYLLQQGADVNARDRFGRTLLVKFSNTIPDIPIARLLIEYGADWRVLIGKSILKQLIRTETKKLREELNQTLQVFKQVYYKEGHKVDTYLLIRLAYEKIYSELCHVTPREFPPLKLLALALVLDKDYKIEIKESWSELCQRVSKQVTDPKYYPPVKQYTPGDIPEDINNNNNL